MQGIPGSFVDEPPGSSCVRALVLIAAGSVRAATPTYNRDIAPILWKQCAGCHRPGEIGPFSLLTYRDAAKPGATCWPR